MRFNGAPLVVRTDR